MLTKKWENNTWVLTHAGFEFDLSDPQPDMICLEDIAFSLAQQPRFNGHSKFHYSVAQHSILVANLVPDFLKLPALFHDAHEAYIGDLVRPLIGYVEVECPEFKKVFCSLRAKIDAAVVERFSLMNFGHHLVAAADLQALATERRDLLPASSPWGILEGVKPHAFPIIRQFEKEARYNFLNMYYDLGGNK